MKRLFVFYLLFSSSLATVYAENGAPNPRILIDKMSKASRNLNYDGVFVYRLGKKMETIRIIHKSGEDGIHEKLISLTGHAREIVRNKDEVKCFYPEDKKVLVDKNYAEKGKLVSNYLPTPIQSISKFYKFELAGEGRIAGMDSWIVNIRPNDKYRYGYQLWIEKKSHLLLKSELKNQRGVTLEQIMFAQLKAFENIDDSLLKPSMTGEGFTWHNNVKNIDLKNDNEKKWQVTSMPIGFSISEQEKESMMSSKMPVEHLVYTDGLAMVSIYVEKLTPQDSVKSGAFRFGGVNAYSTYIEGYQITAVGEAPKATVQLMANSVRSVH